MRATPSILIFALGMLQGPAYGKRAAPAEVPPVVSKGVRYEAPHFRPGKPQNGGYVVAWQDRKKGKQLWEIQVYRIVYTRRLEKDVQDVFITSLKLGPKKDSLLVANERRECFRIDLKTRAVSRGPCAN